MKSISVNVGSVLKERKSMVVTIKVSGARMLSLRLQAGEWLLKVAAVVIGMDIKIDLVDKQ